MSLFFETSALFFSPSLFVLTLFFASMLRSCLRLLPFLTSSEKFDIYFKILIQKIKVNNL